MSLVSSKSFFAVYCSLVVLKNVFKVDHFELCMCYNGQEPVLKKPTLGLGHASLKIHFMEIYEQHILH